MANTLKVEQSNVLDGLGTWTHTALKNSMYYCEVRLTEVPASSVSIVINQNGSPVATSTAPAAAQQVVTLQIIMNCTINDVITVVISSSAPIDQQLNTVKSIVTLRVGQ